METISYTLLILLSVSLILNFILIQKNRKNNSVNIFNENAKRTKELETLSQTKTFEMKYQDILNELKLNHLNELNDLKEKHRSELKTEFDEGIKKGIDLSKMEVRVTPFKNVKKDGNFGFRKEIVEIGYSYRLFSNNLPCLDPHFEIMEKVEVKEINEKFIDLLNEKFNQIMDKIPNSNFVLTESIESFSNKLLKKIL